MLNEEQKKQIRQMAAEGVGYREIMKCVLASKQDIIDYRNELIETGWTPWRGCDECRKEREFLLMVWKRIYDCNNRKKT